MLCLNAKIPSVYIIEMRNAKSESLGGAKIDIRQNFTIEIYGSNNNRTVYWIGKKFVVRRYFFFSLSSSIALFDFFFWSFITFFLFSSIVSLPFHLAHLHSLNFSFSPNSVMWLRIVGISFSFYTRMEDDGFCDRNLILIFL